ncbi:MAG: hypothetical protein U5L96_08110 [Owenweeksia sp.]|nr:hypothetical protein [Owenweeksia sp.]
MEGFTYTASCTTAGLSLSFDNNIGQDAEVEMLLPEGTEVIDPEGEVIYTVTGDPKR